MSAPPPASFRTIAPDDAGRLIAAGVARVLDVRSPEEFTALGHIPGAILLPVELSPCAVATLPRDGRPLLVVCEHGIRSAHAAALLVRALPGAEVLNLAGGMSCWRGPRDHAPGEPFGETGPSSWLMANADLLPRGGSVIDVACGAGRHALLLAAAGFRVRAVDRDAEKIAFLRDAAARLDLPVEAAVVDLEAGPPGGPLDGPGAAVVDLGTAAFDLVLVVHYLHRPLFPALTRALKPGGLLIYETYTIAQAARGRPTNPDFLLQPGELPRLAAPLEILRRREGEFDGRMVAGIVARRA
jgi:rhodanese-related sulfurtransferase